MSSATLNRKKLKAKKVLLIIDDAISESTFINSPSFLKIFIQGLHTSVWRALRSLLDCFGRAALWYLGYGDVPIVHEGMDFPFALVPLYNTFHRYLGQYDSSALISPCSHRGRRKSTDYIPSTVHLLVLHVIMKSNVYGRSSTTFEKRVP